MQTNVEILQGLLEKLEVFHREYVEVVEMGESSELRIMREMREGELLPFYVEIKQWFFSVAYMLEVMLLKQDSEHWGQGLAIDGIVEGVSLQQRFEFARNFLQSLIQKVDYEYQEVIALEQMIEQVREKAGMIDRDIIVYLREAVKCLMIDAILASTVMIGGASEIVVERLIGVYGKAIQDGEERKNFEKMLDSKRFIAGRFDGFINSIRRIKCESRDVNVTDALKLIRNMFEWYRYTRNVGGHPEIQCETLTKAAVISNLYQFPVYLERVRLLMDYFESNGVILKEKKGA